MNRTPREIPDPVPALKRQLARAIVERFSFGGQFAMARRLGIDQPRASNLEHGRLEPFSLQQLVRFVARAEGEVTIDIRWVSQRIPIFDPRTARVRRMR